MLRIVWQRVAGIVLLLLLGFQGNVSSLESPGGDLAPLGGPDGRLTAGDAVVLQRLISGNLTPTPQQALIADIAPLGYPDGALNAGDYLLLMRAIMGEISLAPVYIGPAAPVLDAVSSPTSNNPDTITGTAEPGVDINLYVAGGLQVTVTASQVDGTFSVPAALTDGSNTIYATASNAGIEGGASNVLNVEYINTTPRVQSGTLTQDTVWTPGSGNEPYMISADLTIAAGSTLTLQPGTRLQFDDGFSLIADGGLKILGSDTAPVVLTSNTGQVSGAWAGIVINPVSHGSIIDFAVIEYAVTGVHVQNSTLTLSSSTINEFYNEGVRIANADDVTISNNLITNPVRRGTGILLDNASPSIVSNVISSSNYGIHIAAGSDPVITGGNSITLNYNGIYVSGNGSAEDDPNPVITANSLFSNVDYNIASSSQNLGSDRHTVNATGNWWGSADLGVIYDGIYDKGKVNYNPYATNTSAMIDWRGFLDSENGAPVPGGQITGFISTPTVLNSTTPIDVVGSLYVLPDSALTVQAGVTLKFYNSLSKLWVGGRLEINGEPGLPVTLTSGKDMAVRAREDWRGVAAYGDQADVSINGATVEYAYSGILFHDSNENDSVSSSLIRNNRHGIEVRGTNTAVNDTSPVISANTLSNNQDGLYLRARSAPLVSNGNIISNNNTGIRVFASSDDNITYKLNPIIQGNSIYNNGLNYYADYVSLNPNWYYYQGTEPHTMLDARGNWWGTSDPFQIASSIRDTNSKGVDFRNYLLSENGPAFQGNQLIGIIDTTTLQPGTSYETLDNLVIPAGQTLEIMEGVELDAIGALTAITVAGNLTVTGTAANPVLFKSTVITLPFFNPSLQLDHLILDNGRLRISGESIATITNSVFRNYTNYGIETGSTGTVLLSNNVFYPSGSTQSQTKGISVTWGSPTIQGNTVFGNSYGVSVDRGTPNISNGNIITGNENGIWVSEPNSTPKALPVVTNNSIFDNTLFNYHANGPTDNTALTLDASNNWWGTSDPVAIEAKIRDISEFPTTAPTVNYVPYQGMESIPLALSLYSPIDGEITTQATRTITGRVNKPAQLTINSISVSPSPVLDFSYGPVTLSEGANVFTLDATDLTGDSISNTITVTLDSMPPVAPDTALISTPVSGADTVTITGANSSVEPLSTITIINSHTGSTATTTADLNGSFTIVIQGQPGDDLAIYATDSANQQSLWSWTQVEGAAPAPNVTISQPVDGSSVDGSYITVQGTIQGPVNTGISVNGIVGAISGDQFVVDRVPLDVTGPTTLEALAITPDGQLLTTSVGVTPSGYLPPDITIAPASGIAPLPVTFNVSSTSLNDINSIAIDVDNDGSIDLSGTDISYTYGGTVTVLVNGNPVDIPVVTDATASYTYTQPGIYTASVQITDSDSITRSYQQTVVVESLASADARLRKTYSDMLDLLKAGNAQDALLRIDAHTRNHYASVFTYLATQLNTISDQQRDIRNGSIGSEWAEYTILRDTGNGTQAFSINFIKGRDGVWRIQNM